MTGAQQTFSKHRSDAPDGFFAVEAAGLRWLAEAEGAGGVPVVRPLAVTPRRIDLQRLRPVVASAAAAEALGRGLAATHRVGARHFGCPPDGWSGDGFIGPLPLPHVPADDPAAASWSQFYSRFRVQPFARAAAKRGSLEPADAQAVERVCERLTRGSDLAGAAEPPGRLHGDLWAGNVLWTAGGPVLVDPAAHGGHRETDLAMLALFGLAHLDRVLAAYTEAWPLQDGWRERVGLHQLHPLLVHAALFGGGYGAQAGAVARRYA
ncbi:MAG TPA: fructosamine kinase family protein [Kineosporiaceae bacterium]|nr:fructosamine kinase family protein [Kineosporiaceae bacterium]